VLGKMKTKTRGGQANAWPPQFVSACSQAFGASSPWFRFWSILRQDEKPKGGFIFMEGSVTVMDYFDFVLLAVISKRNPVPDLGRLLARQNF
jgi:hypothetical protein